MKQPISIFFMSAGLNPSGVATFTWHLYKSLEMYGFEPMLFRIGKKERSVPFLTGLTLHTLTLDNALAMVRSNPSIISYSHSKENIPPTLALIRSGVPMVLHDPCEFYGETVDTMKSMGYRPIVIRTANVEGLKRLGVESSYIPHMYCPTEPVNVDKIRHGVSIARIDGRKRIETIIAANKLLPPELHVTCYGNINRVYEYHVLRKKHPDWKRWYGGEFSTKWGSAVRLVCSSNFTVDLTVIKGDGGGTQYSFFETWNAGVPLIINRQWLIPNGSVKDGVNCVAVDGEHELADVLKQDPKNFSHLLDNGRKLMDQHTPDAVIPIYKDVCGWNSR